MLSGPVLALHPPYCFPLRRKNSYRGKSTRCQHPIAVLHCEETGQLTFFVQQPGAFSVLTRR